MGAAPDLRPRPIALLRGHGNAAGELEQARRAGKERTPTVDTEDDLISFHEAERVADGFRHGSRRCCSL
jgi:hypothetical protein